MRSCDRPFHSTLSLKKLLASAILLAVGSQSLAAPPSQAWGKRPPLASAAARPSEYTQKLIGSWAPEGEPCDGDAGIIYNADGTWIASGSSGTWTVRGSLLVMLTRLRGEPGEAMRRFNPPERDNNTIVSISQKSMTQRFSDGSVMSFLKCPS